MIANARQDVITDDEIISDAYKIQDKGILLEVDGRKVTKGSERIGELLYIHTLYPKLLTGDV